MTTKHLPQALIISACRLNGTLALRTINGGVVLGRGSQVLGVGLALDMC